ASSVVGRGMGGLPGGCQSRRGKSSRRVSQLSRRAPLNAYLRLDLLPEREQTVPPISEELRVAYHSLVTLAAGTDACHREPRYGRRAAPGCFLPLRSSANSGSQPHPYENLR